TDVWRDAGREVLIVEGEKKVDALTSLGLLATTSAGGAQTPRKSDWSVLAGREVAILPDHDEPGHVYAREVADIVLRLSPPARVKIVTLPELLIEREQVGELHDGDDIADLIERRRARGLDNAEIAESIATHIESADSVVEEPRPERNTKD